MAKKQSSKSKPCGLCERGTRVFVDDSGVRWHSWKESNGMDYDTYTYPCMSIEQNFVAYRKQVREFVKKRVDEAKGRLAELENILSEINSSKHVHEIASHADRLRSI